MFRRRIALVAAVAVGCLTLACGPKGPNDQALTNDIQGKLYANDATRAANVKVAVSNGAVTLSGEVPNSDVELQAMKIANGTAGVSGVTDQMKVNTAMAPPPVPATDAANPAQPSQPASAPAKQAATEPRPPSANEPTRDAAPPRPATRTYTIPSGQRVSIRMIDSIDTGKNTEGQTFRASLDAPLTSGGRVVVPAGAPVTVLLAESKGAGRIKGQSSLELRATAIGINGESVPINTAAYSQQGSARGKQSAIRTGIGAAAGALIGGLAGGGKGAAIGSLAGGGAGAGFQLATHGQQVKIPSETQLVFVLQAPLTVTVQRHASPAAQ
jgi:BON domain-containing protein